MSTGICYARSVKSLNDGRFGPIGEQVLLGRSDVSGWGAFLKVIFRISDCYWHA